MTYFVGVDEAGYGPNLGPLTISATVWRCDDMSAAADLYETLSDVVCAAPRGGDARLAIADSKALYKPGGGLGALERGVLAALAACGEPVASWRELWRRLEIDGGQWLDAIPWYDGYDAPLPGDCDLADVQSTVAAFSAGLNQAGVSLLDVRTVAVFAERFNEAIETRGNKSAALSHFTLDLVRRLIERLDDAPIVVRCDKHGGRDRYAALLQQAFPDHLVQVKRESRQESVYVWGSAERRVQVSFAARGESFLPAALASMASKYLREQAMRAFNQFWRHHLPHIKPTAGYPVDARRFKQDIAPAQRKLGVDDRILWRNR